MKDLTLETARTIIAAAFEKGREMGLNPLTVAVLDAGGALKALERCDGASLMRPDIAIGKAYGAVAMGLGSRALFKRAQEQPYFTQALNALARGSLVPVPGGVLISDHDGVLMGAVGITGDTSDADEACAVAGIEAAGLKADIG
jgi:uncharacterized protein GlcG (DUF336 family)